MTRCCSLVALLLATTLFAQGEVDPPRPDGSEAGTKQIAGFRKPPGAEVKLFAAEPQLHSPVALCVDERGRVFVTEEYRFNRGTEENRTRPFLLEDDLQLRTTDDRLAMFQKHADKFTGGMAWFTKFTDRVVRLVDKDGDGRADESTVFADGFNGELDGLAAGVLARDGDVYVTNIPHLWRLRDEDGDGRAEKREKLLSGFGVNAAFLGHDLHGLAWGVDGRLYFTVGDRGFSVTTKEGKRLTEARRGAVFRCKPDGSQFEVVHRGLRNPQELALDDFGELFADDNNCDKGDHARLVWVVEGGDSGWNMAYQTIAEPYLTGPWHAEKLWHLATPEQPAYIVPPVGKLGAGPSGFAYDMGWGLPERYRGHFFMCNYTGGGGIESFAVQPKGAAYEIVDAHDFLKPLNATDCEIGPDGKMYVSDFVNLDWSGKSLGGRVYTVSFPEEAKATDAPKTAEILQAGFAKRADAELLALLAHADQRVRLRAQFALADRGTAVVSLQKVAVSPAKDRLTRLARLHAIWGLGQIAEQNADVLEPVVPLLSDADVEIRCQTAKTLGRVNFTAASNALIAALTDDNDRVKFHAAIALGKLRQPAANDGLLTLARENADRDPYLRHAAVVGLAGCADAAWLKTKIADADAAVRRAVLLVYRRWSDSAEVGWYPQFAGGYTAELTRFLNDPDPGVSAEAARALHDFHLDAANEALAATATRFVSATSPPSDALARRVIAANDRLGGAEHAALVARLAGAPHISTAVRREALATLQVWGDAANRDRVTGYWRPRPARDLVAIRPALEAEAPKLLSSLPAELQPELAKLLQKLQLKVDLDTFFAWVADESRAADTRAAALRYVASTSDSRVAAALDGALQSPEAGLRATARELLASRDAIRAFELVREVIADKDLPPAERQAAVAILPRLKSAEADAFVVRRVNAFAARSIQDPAAELDLIEAAAARGTPELKAALADYEAARGKDNPHGRFEATLEGGDPERGRAIFMGNAQAQCVRCHKVLGVGGDVGPELSRLGAKTDPRQFRQSMLEPDAMISPGFGSVTLELDDGRIIVGTLKAESDEQLDLLLPDGRLLKIPTATVEQRSNPKSPMPAMDKILTPREVRDLVAFLMSLK